MALMKLDPSTKKNMFKLPSSEDANISSVTDPRYFRYLNPFSLFYWKRVTVQNSRGDEPAVTRIEEAIFTCSPQKSTHKQYSYLNGLSLGQLFQSDNFEKHNISRRKHTNSKKHNRDYEGSRKNGKPQHKHKETSKGLYQKLILAVMLACPFFLWWLSTQYWCQVKPLEFAHLETSLKYEVIGQQEALNSLLLNFYRTSNVKSQPPVFVLSGSTGVGKSFVVDLVLKHFPGLGHKELLFYPTPAPEIVVESLKDCEHNLLVIDSLYFKDSQEMAFWAERLQKESVIRQKHVWLLLTFTTEHWTNDTTVTSHEEFLQEISKISKTIEAVFQGHGISTRLITFKPMEADHVKDCVRKELENLNLSADEVQLNKIVEKLTSTPALRLKGCKNVKKFFSHSDNFTGLPRDVD